MAKSYIYKKADDSWSDPHALWRVMEAAERHIRQGAGPFVINADGDPVAQDLTRQEALDRSGAAPTAQRQMQCRDGRYRAAWSVRVPTPATTTGARDCAAPSCQKQIGQTRHSRCG
jgi:hypothetical protein